MLRTHLAFMFLSHRRVGWGSTGRWHGCPETGLSQWDQWSVRRRQMISGSQGSALDNIRRKISTNSNSTHTPADTHSVGTSPVILFMFH